MTNVIINNLFRSKENKNKNTKINIDKERERVGKEIGETRETSLQK